MVLMQIADDAGPDQPEHLRRLIRVFVARLQNQWKLQYMSKKRECCDRTARIRTLTWIFVFCIWHKGLFPTLCIFIFDNPVCLLRLWLICIWGSHVHISFAFVLGRKRHAYVKVVYDYTMTFYFCSSETKTLIFFFVFFCFFFCLLNSATC